MELDDDPDARRWRDKSGIDDYDIDDYDKIYDGENLPLYDSDDDDNEYYRLDLSGDVDELNEEFEKLGVGTLENFEFMGWNAEDPPNEPENKRRKKTDFGRKGAKELSLGAETRKDEKEIERAIEAENAKIDEARRNKIKRMVEIAKQAKKLFDIKIKAIRKIYTVFCFHLMTKKNNAEIEAHMLRAKKRLVEIQVASNNNPIFKALGKFNKDAIRQKVGPGRVQIIISSLVDDVINKMDFIKRKDKSRSGVSFYDEKVAAGIGACPLGDFPGYEDPFPKEFKGFTNKPKRKR